MPRSTLTFRLSSAEIRTALLEEFSLHPGVRAHPSSDGDSIVVETMDAAKALWDVRATVGMFDDHAEEVPAQ